MSSIDVNPNNSLFMTVSFSCLLGVAVVAIGHCLQGRVRELAMMCFQELKESLSSESSDQALGTLKQRYVSPKFLDKDLLIRDIKAKGCFYLCFTVCIFEQYLKNSNLKNNIDSFILSSKEPFKESLQNHLKKIAGGENIENLLANNQATGLFSKFLRNLAAQAVEEAEYSTRVAICQEMGVASTQQVIEKVRDNGEINHKIIPLLFDKVRFSLQIINKDNPGQTLLPSEYPSIGKVVLDFRKSHYQVLYC